MQVVNVLKKDKKGSMSNLLESSHKKQRIIPYVHVFSRTSAYFKAIIFTLLAPFRSVRKTYFSLYLGKVLSIEVKKAKISDYTSHQGHLKVRITVTN